MLIPTLCDHHQKPFVVVSSHAAFHFEMFAIERASTKLLYLYIYRDFRADTIALLLSVQDARRREKASTKTMSRRGRRDLR
jgi:hypothetical protein